MGVSGFILKFSASRTIKSLFHTFTHLVNWAGAQESSVCLVSNSLFSPTGIWSPTDIKLKLMLYVILNHSIQYIAQKSFIQNNHLSDNNTNQGMEFRCSLTDDKILIPNFTSEESPIRRTQWTIYANRNKIRTWVVLVLFNDKTDNRFLIFTFKSHRFV